METLHEWLGNIYHRMRLCSFVEELNDIVGKFNCDTVGVCWDFGHAALVYKEDQFKAMKRLKYPIITTHIHDNIFKYDNHNLPFQGSINWDEAMKTLAEQGHTLRIFLRLTKIANAHSCIKSIEIMPYHPLGIAKSERIGKEISFADTEFLDGNITETCRRVYHGELYRRTNDTLK